MGMYYNKLLKESAVEPEDVIQTADEVGNDLQAIEKAVEDEHKEGLDGGCFCDGSDCACDEAAIIMFESQYNMDQLMKRIGLTELHEFSEGRDFVLEGVNMKAFLGKVADAIKAMFKKFVEMYQKAKAAMYDLIHNDKALMAHAGDLRIGAKAANWEYKCFDLDALDPKANPAVKFSMFDGVVKAHDDIVDASNKKDGYAACIKKACGVEAADAAEMAAKLKEALHKEVTLNQDSDVAEKLIKILGDKSDMKALEDAYKNVKGAYEGALKQLKKWEDAATDAGEDDEYEGSKKDFADRANLANFMLAVQNSCYKVCLSAYRERRSIARRLAVKLIEQGKKDKKDGAKTESAKLFDFDLI